MEKFYHVLIIIHVAAGVFALLSGLIAILLRRNTPRHKPAGRIYFWCMTVIFITGIILSVARQLLFFFFIAVFSYYLTLIAYRALRLKKLHEDQKPAMLDWLIQAIAAIVFGGMVIYAMFYKTGNAIYIPVVFGAIGLTGVYRNSKLFVKKPKRTNYWLKIHLGNMIGSYIGAITAFLVNQTDVIHINPFFLWFGPGCILAPLIFIELKKVRSEPIPR